jgi:hypothetical protein
MRPTAEAMLPNRLECGVPRRDLPRLTSLLNATPQCSQQLVSLTLRVNTRYAFGPELK